MTTYVKQLESPPKSNGDDSDLPEQNKEMDELGKLPTFAERNWQEQEEESPLSLALSERTSSDDAWLKPPLEKRPRLSNR